MTSPGNIPQTDFEPAHQKAPNFEVTFFRSGVTALWTSKSGTILELAEASGVDIDYGCRYGDCATCQTELVSGQVSYVHNTGAQPDPGTCLPCSCEPTTHVVLNV